MKVNVALEMDRSRRELAGGHEHPPATRFVASLDGFAKSGSAVGLATCDGAKARYREITSGKNGGLDAIQNDRA